MIKKFIIASLATVLTVGPCLPAVTAEAAVNSDKYLGQTVDSNGKYQGWYNSQMAAGDTILTTEN